MLLTPEEERGVEVSVDTKANIPASKGMLKIREIRGHWLFNTPLIPKSVTGITLYPFILYRSVNPSKELIRHEWAHVDQVRRVGWFKFYFSYIWHNFRKGYAKNPYEQEARQETHKNHNIK